MKLSKELRNAYQANIYFHYKNNERNRKLFYDVKNN